MNEINKLLKLVGNIVVHYELNETEEVVKKVVLLGAAYDAYNDSLICKPITDVSQLGTSPNKPSQKDRHVGSSDYSKNKIQPYHIWAEYELDPFRADLVKRILRTKSEEGKTLRECKLQDLNKMIHIIQTMIEDYESNNFPWDKL